MNIISLIPRCIRKRLVNPKDFKWRRILKKRINQYYKNSKDKEIGEALQFINDNKLTAFPYSFIDKYETRDMPVFKDKESGLFYVLENEKKLYFRRSLNSKSKVRYYYNATSKEQDPKSPHRYLSNEHNVQENDCIIDCGVAEGNFALEVIDQVRKIYLVECDPAWIEALQYTFAPYKSKVVIIPKIVSNQNTDREITLEKIIEMENGNVNFIKMDIEGSEVSILTNSKAFLKKMHNCKLSVCTYHSQNDEHDIRSIFEGESATIQATPGYILNYFDKTLKEPYFRRGVLYIDLK